MDYAQHIREPEDFQVDEIAEPGFLRKFHYTGGHVQPMSGRYALCLLRKRGRTTESVMRELARKLGVPLSHIGYAGLKDKNAVTTQYVTVKCVAEAQIGQVQMKDAQLTFLQKTDRQMAVGDLWGNRFRIMLHGVEDKKLPMAGVKRIKEHGFLNLFGPQRFGADRQNHLRGLRILREKKTAFSKNRTKFFIHAYQSWLFNRAVEACNAFNGNVELLGFESREPANDVEKKCAQIAQRDGISRSDFRIDELRLMCRGSVRAVRVKPIGMEAGFGEPVMLTFSLPAGSFATALLQEIFKG